jgi:hypothetical protein
MISRRIAAIGILLFAFIAAIDGVSGASMHPTVVSCMATEQWPGSIEGALFARMDEGAPACKKVALQYACGYAYARTLGVTQNEYECMFACAPHLAECNLPTAACGDGAVRSVAQCYERITLFVHDAFGSV